MNRIMLSTAFALFTSNTALATACPTVTPAEDVLCPYGTSPVPVKECHMDGQTTHCCITHHACMLDKPIWEPSSWQDIFDDIFSAFDDYSASWLDSCVNDWLDDQAAFDISTIMTTHATTGEYLYQAIEIVQNGSRKYYAEACFMTELSTRSFPSSEDIVTGHSYDSVVLISP